MTETELTEIPMPQILDADRLALPETEELTIDDHRERVDAVLYELRRTCDYGQALRAELQGVREYLSTRVPGDPNDLDAWRTWRIVYASVVSSLAGAKGDSGFGVEEASLIAERHGVYLDRT